MEDDLAEDSGDEKRIEPVEMAAGRKIAQKQKAKGLGRGRGYGRGDSDTLQPVGRRQLQQPLARRVCCLMLHMWEPGHMRREYPKRSTSTTMYPPNLGNLNCVVGKV